MLDTSKKSGNPAFELGHRNNTRDILDDVIVFSIHECCANSSRYSIRFLWRVQTQSFVSLYVNKQVDTKYQQTTDDND